MRRFLAIGCLLLIAPAALAAEPSKCPLTPRLSAVNYPGVKNIPTTNNLLRPTGKSLDAPGQQVILMGRVLDSNCMPVPDATLELWQVDPFGKWILATPADIATPSPLFAGAGRTYTDRDGQFSFITAFPGVIKHRDPRLNRAPHFNIRVSAKSFSAFSTALYFANDGRNATDHVLKGIPAATRSRVMLNMQPLSTTTADGLYGTIDIVLPGKVPYLRY